MELGTVTHSLILGTPPTWRVIDGGAGVTKRREAARTEGLIPVSADDLEHAQAMAAAVHANAECVEWLDKAPCREVAAIAQDPETGTWVRGFFDALHAESRYGIDVKTGRDGTLADFGEGRAFSTGVAGSTSPLRSAEANSFEERRETGPSAYIRSRLRGTMGTGSPRTSVRI